jgi:hypothetical protein
MDNKGVKSFFKKGLVEKNDVRLLACLSFACPSAIASWFGNVNPVTFIFLASSFGNLFMWAYIRHRYRSV